MVLRIARPRDLVTTERILWVEESTSSFVLIDIDQKAARDYRFPISELITSLSDGTAREIEDPFSYLHLTDAEYSAARLSDRDRRLGVIAPFVNASPECRFDPSSRREIMRNICDPNRTEPVSKSVAYGLTRQYLQRGQFDNALMSDRCNCGYTRERRETNPPTRKEGRSYKADTIEEQRSGLIITEELRRQLLPTITSQRKILQKSGLPKSWPDVAQHVWDTYFFSHFERIGGKLVPIPKPQDQCPTERQIKHIHSQHHDLKSTLISREGEHQFELRMREKLGDQKDVAYGPMMTVQIDFTVADIYLLDHKKKRIIGRPTIAMIRDTFSRLIIGVAVAWKHESWHTASLAILNMVTDKVEFCREYDVDITPDMWPSAMFETALTDNGALLAYLAENFRKGLELHFDHTASGRGDRKPVIESGFDDINAQLIHRLEGAILPAKDRKEAKERIRFAKAHAKYTIREFTKFVIEYCVHFNNFRVIGKYPIPDDMAGEVAAIPIQMWDFGVHKRAGLPQKVSVDKARYHCLCRGEAAIRESGMYFEGKPYSCARAEREGWFVKARNGGNWKVSILYHPLNLSMIYLAPPDAGKPRSDAKPEPCWRIRTEGDTPEISLVELRRLKMDISNLTRKANRLKGQHNARFRAKTVGADVKPRQSGFVLSTNGDMRDLRHEQVELEAADAHRSLCPELAIKQDSNDTSGTDMYEDECSFLEAENLI
jgi:hypothetical protein